MNDADHTFEAARDAALEDYFENVRDPTPDGITVASRAFNIADDPPDHICRNCAAEVDPLINMYCPDCGWRPDTDLEDVRYRVRVGGE